MLALKIVLFLVLITLGGVVVWLLFGLLIGPLIFKGIFNADLNDIAEKRKREECVKMDFDKWYDIYCLNTKKWGLSCLPHRRINNHNYKHGDVVLNNYWSLNYFDAKDVYVDFGFVGNLKYSLWRRNYIKAKEARETNEKEVKNLKLILESAQSDIEILKKKSEEEISKAAETSKKVKENLNNQELRWYHNNFAGKDIIAPVKMKTGYGNAPSMITNLDDDKADF